MHYYKIILFFFIIICFISCKTFNEDNDGPKIQRIVKLNQDGILDTLPSAIAGEVVQKAILEKIGDKVEFPVGQPFELIIQSINPGEMDLNYTFDENKQMGYLSVVKKEEIRKVVLKDKCQIERIPPGELPLIEIANGMAKEQIIITPLFNNKKDCEFLGYEIRYGSQEKGCRSANVSIFNDCMKNNNGNNKVKSKPKKIDYWLDYLFGK